jgi:hypothetical protein
MHLHISTTSAFQERAENNEYPGPDLGKSLSNKVQNLFHFTKL